MHIVLLLVAAAQLAVDPELELVEPIELAKLSDARQVFYAWPQPGGLTVFWNDDRDQIWSASRSAPDKYFQDARLEAYGRHPRGSDGESLHVCTRKDTEEAFPRAQPISELSRARNPKSPCLVGDGLVMYFLESAGQDSTMLMRTERKDQESEWEAPKPIRLPLPNRQTYLTWVWVDSEEKLLLGSIEGGGTASGQNNLVVARAKAKSRFGRIKPLALNVRELGSTRAPRYVRDTNELFLTRKQIGDHKDSFPIIIIKNVTLDP